MTEEKLGILSQRIYEFNQNFEDDEACIQELFRRYNVSLKCPNCKCTDVLRPHGARRFRCRRCWNYYSAFLDTPFERIKRLREGLLLLWLKERKVEFNTQDFHGFTRLSYPSVEKLESKLIPAIIEATKDPIAACEACKGTGKCAVCCASSPSQSPAPQADCGDETNEESQPGGFWGPISQSELSVLEHINEKFRHFDILCDLTGLSVGDVAAAVTILEMRKMIISRGQYYQRS